MPKVYAPSVPSRFDSGTQMWIPTVDLSAAQRFGELIVMLPPNAARAGLGPCVSALKERMQDYGKDDMLIGVGNPQLIGAASIVAARATCGVLRMLTWDRFARDYSLTEVRV